MVENTHDPLVSRELFNQANELISVKGRLTWKLYPVIGRYLQAFSSVMMRQGDEPSELWKQQLSQDLCLRLLLHLRCSQHKIFEDDIYNAVLADIQSKAKIAFVSKDELVRAIVKAGIDDDLIIQRARQKRYQNAVKRLKEVETLFEKLYEDSAFGRITQENFERLTAKYQQRLQQRMRLSEPIPDNLLHCITFLKRGILYIRFC